MSIYGSAIFNRSYKSALKGMHRIDKDADYASWAILVVDGIMSTLESVTRGSTRTCLMRELFYSFTYCNTRVHYKRFLKPNKIYYFGKMELFV